MKKMKNKGYKAGGKMKAKGGPIRKMKKGMKVKGYKAGGKPDFLDLDKDGDTTEPMKTAARSSKTMKAKGGTIKKMAKGGTIKKMKKGKKVAPDTSPRPKARPLDTSMDSSLRPKARPAPKATAGMAGRNDPSRRANRDRPSNAGKVLDVMSSAAMGPAAAAGKAAKRAMGPAAAAGKAAKRAMGMAKGGTIRKMKGGKMVTKGGTKGGAKGGKAKVRGAGIAQRGVRPAKMR